MPIIKIEMKINAPIERVFDLARCIDLHTESMSNSKEKAVAGKTKGLINKDETVTCGSNSLRHQTKIDFKDNDL